MWGAFLRTALLPLLLVEVALIAVYLAVNASALEENQEAVRTLAEQELTRIAAREASRIDIQLAGIAQLTDVYRRQTAEALGRPHALTPEQQDAYAYTPDGVMYYTQRDTGGSALYYSGIVPVGPEQREKAWRTAQLDPLMRDILATSPLIVQLYFNAHDSMNRILPYFDVVTQYTPKMDIPSYNFYYEADARHNPGRGVVWTDAYVDPAGKGWMISSIAPVYRGDFLEGVVGLDVTTATIVDAILDLPLPWGGYGVLVGKDGTVLALPPAGEHDWGLRELTSHNYREYVLQDTFKPDRFNLYKRPDLRVLGDPVQAAAQGLAELDLGGPRVATWATVAQTGWRLLVIVPEANIYAQASDLGRRTFRIGALMVGALALFYAVFLAFIARRARQVAAEVAAPLTAIDRLVERIAGGEYDLTPPATEIAELRATAAGVAAMGRQLGERSHGLVAAQREAEAARDAAVHASRLKSEFLATVSHEIRTPMNIILGMNEHLLEDLPAGEDELRTCAEAVGTAARDLLQIIDDILDLSRIEAGRLSIAVEACAPAAIAEATTTLLAPQAHARGLSLSLAIDPAVPAALRGDEGRVRQVLVNLVGNALKFTPRGEVALRVRVAGSDEHAVVVRFEVEDTGIGVDDADRQRLFQPFTQVDGSHARRYGGAGLGLSICKRLVESMGGTIGVDSVKGVGSTFWFELPLARSGEVEPAPPRPLAGVRARVAIPGGLTRASVLTALRGLGAEVVEPGAAAEVALIAGPLAAAAELAAGAPALYLAERPGHGLEAQVRAAGLACHVVLPCTRAQLRAGVEAALAGGPVDPQAMFSGT